MKFKDVQLTSEGIKTTKPNEWAIRFIFGGIISVMTYFISQKFGAEFGGLFLGFPSILPATITLIQKKDGCKAASHCAGGAIAGSIGLVAFALVVCLISEKCGEGVTLLSATLTWLFVSCTTWRFINLSYE